MQLRLKKIKKIQSSLHLSPSVDEEVRRRTIVSKRSFSSEIEYILEKHFTQTALNNEEAIKLAEKHTSLQTEQQSPLMDE